MAWAVKGKSVSLFLTELQSSFSLSQPQTSDLLLQLAAGSDHSGQRQVSAIISLVWSSEIANASWLGWYNLPAPVFPIHVVDSVNNLRLAQSCRWNLNAEARPKKLSLLHEKITKTNGGSSNLQDSSWVHDYYSVLFKLLNPGWVTGCGPLVDLQNHLYFLVFSLDSGNYWMSGLGSQLHIEWEINSFIRVWIELGLTGWLWHLQWFLQLASFAFCSDASIILVDVAKNCGKLKAQGYVTVYHRT
jgi:hypothetical protein